MTRKSYINTLSKMLHRCAGKERWDLDRVKNDKLRNRNAKSTYIIRGRAYREVKDDAQKKTRKNFHERTVSGVLWRCAGTDFGRRVDGGRLDTMVVESITLLSFNVAA